MNYFVADESCHYMNIMKRFSGKYVATKAIQLDKYILIVGHYGEINLYDFTKVIKYRT